MYTQVAVTAKSPPSCDTEIERSLQLESVASGKPKQPAASILRHIRADTSIELPV